MELFFPDAALIYLEEHNENLFRERFQMYFIFVMAFPRDHAWVHFCLRCIQAKSLTLSVITYLKFIVIQMTSSFINRLTQAVLLVKTGQLDQWKPVSRTLGSGWPRTNLCLMTTKPNLL